MAEVLYKDDELRFYVFRARDVPDGVPRTLFRLNDQFCPSEWTARIAGTGRSYLTIVTQWRDETADDLARAHCAVAFEHAGPLLVGCATVRDLLETQAKDAALATAARRMGEEIAAIGAAWDKPKAPSFYVGQRVCPTEMLLKFDPTWGDQVVSEVLADGRLRVACSPAAIWEPGCWEPAPPIDGSPAKPESPLAEVVRKLGEATRAHEPKMILATYRGTGVKSLGTTREGCTFIARPGAWKEPAAAPNVRIVCNPPALPGSVVCREALSPADALRFVRDVEAAGVRQRQRIVAGIEAKHGENGCRLNPAQSFAWSEELRVRIEASAAADAEREARLSGWDPYGDDL